MSEAGWLNPRLDRAALAAAYARDGWVQVEDVLAPQIAEAFAEVLARRTPWSLAHADDRGGASVLEPGRLAQTAEPEVRERLHAAIAQAAERFSYIYLVYPMIEAYVAGRDPDHPLHGLTDFLNSPEFIDFAAAITAEPVVKVDAQATCYRPGHFLSLHDDLGVGERRAAYTLGFTRGWRPDWGGQLLFHDARGDVVRGFAPRFNVLTLFRVPLAHSVAPVAPYAAQPRYTIAGWLRDDPPDGAARGAG